MDDPLEPLPNATEASKHYSESEKLILDGPPKPEIMIAEKQPEHHGTPLPIAHNATDSICAYPDCVQRLNITVSRFHCRRCNGWYCGIHAGHPLIAMKLTVGIGEPDPNNGVWSRVCLRCFRARFYDYPVGGVERDVSEKFFRQRNVAVSRRDKDRGKLIARLEMLSDYKSQKIPFRVHEQQMIRWEKDNRVGCCRICKYDNPCKCTYYCRELFTAIKRKHHCRLCGHIICGDIECSHFVPIRIASMNDMRDIRICSACDRIAFPHRLFLSETDDLIPLYSELCQVKRQVSGILPKFEDSLDRLRYNLHSGNNGNNNFRHELGNERVNLKKAADLRQDAAAARETLMVLFKHMELVGAKIRHLETKAHQKSVLQLSIYRMAISFLQRHMISLQMLPSNEAVRRASIRPPASNEGMISTSNFGQDMTDEPRSANGTTISRLRESLLVLHEQKKQLESFVTRAVREKRLDEISALRISIDEIDHGVAPASEMRLDASALRYLTKDDFRILSALEIGSKNHEVVPLSMLSALCRLRSGAIHARLGELSKHRLVAKEHQQAYEGYRLTYGGYDYLALHAMSLRGTVEGIGRQIGVGKEADVYIVSGRSIHSTDSEEDGQGADLPIENFVLKIERLGRTSFRTVKSNRDYQGNRKHVSWMYLSRLAAEKEWAFLRALHRHGFPTPRPIDWNRHCIVMECIDGKPLGQVHPDEFVRDGPITTVDIAQYLFDFLMRLLVTIAEHGLIHGDFNEFNILVRQSFLDSPSSYMNQTAIIEPEESDPQEEQNSNSPVVMIDFPQMVSTAHRNSGEFFDRDVTCLRVFFARRFGYDAAEWPCFIDDVQPRLSHSLDSQLKASGFNNFDLEETTTNDSHNDNVASSDETDEIASDPFVDDNDREL